MTSEWSSVRLGDVAASISETHPRNKPRLVFLNTSDVLTGNLLHSEYSSVSGWPGQAKKSIRQHDILFSEIRPANGRYAFVDRPADDFVVSTKLMVIRADTKRVLPKFLYHFLTQTSVTNWLQHIAESRSGTFPQITFDQIAELNLPLPPLETQTIIATFADALQSRIDLNRKMNQTLEGTTRALFKSWFVDFDPVHAKADGRDPGLPAHLVALFPDSFEDSELGEIPKGWYAGTVRDLGDVVCGKTPATANSANYGNDVPFVTIPDMHGRVFVTRTQRGLSNDGAATQPGKTLPPRAICVSCIATVGLVALTSEPCQTNQQINSVIPSDSMSRFYCYFALRERANEIRSRGSGGSVVLNLNKAEFSSLPVLIPAAETMMLFEKIAEPLMDMILLRERESETLGILRDTLLPKLISGEISVREAKSLVQEAINA